MRCCCVLKGGQPQQQTILKQVHVAVFPDISRYANDVDQEFMQAFTFTLKRKTHYKNYNNNRMILWAKLY